MKDKEKYWFLLANVYISDNVLIFVALYALIQSINGDFFCCLSFGCRDPPSINLKKFGLIGGKKMEKRPKRRKHKDNPYTLESLDNGTYTVTFKDVTNKLKVVEISEKVFQIMNSFELEDISELNEFDRHIEHNEVFGNNLYVRAVDKPISLEDEIIRKATFEELKKAINMLPEVQKRRIKKYYFEDKTEQQIADEENSTQQAVYKSLKFAKEKLKGILKK